LEKRAQFRYARHRYAPATRHSTASAMKMKKSNRANAHEKLKTPPKPNRAARQARLKNAAASLNIVEFSFEQVTLGCEEAISDAGHPRPRFKVISGDRRCGVLPWAIWIASCLDFLPYLPTVDRNRRIGLEAESYAAILEFKYRDLEQSFEADRSAYDDGFQSLPGQN
jgi:hypothetical protein